MFPGDMEFHFTDLKYQVKGKNSVVLEGKRHSYSI